MAFISTNVYFVDLTNPIFDIDSPVISMSVVFGIECVVATSVYLGINYLLKYRKRKIEKLKKETEIYDILEEEYKKWDENKTKKV